MVIYTWLNCDLTEPVKVHHLAGNVFSMDSKANRIGVRVYNAGQPVDLSGSASGYCILANGATVPVPGAVSGNKAYIDLIQDCYAVPGIISIVIKYTEGSAITTLAAVVGTVYESRTDNMITPGSSVIEEWSEQISAALQECIDATAGTVKYNAAQSITSAQKTQARTNIGAASAADLTAEATARQAADTAISGSVTQIGNRVTVVEAMNSGKKVCNYANGYYSTSGGQWHSGSGTYRAYDPVPVIPGMLVSSPQMQTGDYYFLFDSNMTFVRNTTFANCPDGVIVPSGVAYCVLQTKATNYSGATITAVTVSDSVLRATRNGVTAADTYLFRNGYYNVSTGNWTDGEGTFRASEFIPVVPGVTVCSREMTRGEYCLFFDADYAYLGYLGNTTHAPGEFTVPYEKAAFAVLQVRTANNTNPNIAAIIKQGVNDQKPIYATLVDGVLTAATKFDRDNDFVVEFMRHGANNLPEFSNLYINPNVNTFPAPFSGTTGMTRVLNIGTDWHAPFVVEAKNNPTGDTPTDKAYTGGNHGYQPGGGAVVNTTAVNDSLSYYIDGVVATEFSGYCDRIEIRWANRVQAYNTACADRVGRYVLTETHCMVFDGEKWNSSVTITPSEDVKIYTYYGFQMSGLLSVFPNVRFVGGDDDRQIYTSQTGGQSSDIRNTAIIAYGSTYRCTIELDLTYDIGDHRFCVDCPNVVHINDNKVYHRVMYNTDAYANYNYSARAFFKFDKV